MAGQRQLAELVALLERTERPWSHHADAIDEHGSALPSLEEEQGLLASTLAEEANETLRSWSMAGHHAVTLLDPAYPDNLRAVHDRPPLLFIAGAYRTDDARSVAVVGSREASDRGLTAARTLAAHLTAAGYTVVSGLARGIDAAAHRAALAAGGRTIAVIGTGIARTYPTEHAELQAEIARTGAVVSPFWPDTEPSPTTFPQRNAVMSGLSLATVIVEASETSGTRVQARRALLHGRPVFLRRPVTAQPWAAELARRPGVHVYEEPAEVTSILTHLCEPGPLTD